MWRSIESPGLLTDLYELTMAAAYFQSGLNRPATFELFIRSLPGNRSYLLAAGLEQALDYLERLAFSPAQIDFLRRHPAFAHISGDFFDFLGGLRFSGDVWAIEEGTPVFALEPLLRVTAPMIEAQIVETFLLSTITFQTLIASKAARVVQSASGRDVVEFGSRRAHGPLAGLLAARAAYIGGCTGTSNVEAHYRFGIPSFGTMAHSFVMAYEDEEQSFRDFSQSFPEHSVLLLDTYNSVVALDKIIAAGLRPQGVRLDSGDLVALSKQVRQRLDLAGLTSTKIVASGDLDEESIAALLAAGAPIDTFGVGTVLATSLDSPALSGVYKLVQFEHQPRAKFSEQEEKMSYPGCKQVFRFAKGPTIVQDIIATAEEDYPGAQPLLSCVMKNGQRVAPAPSLDQIHKRAAQSMSRLPAEVRRFEHATPYPVSLSRQLMDLLSQCGQSLSRPRKTGEVSHANFNPVLGR